MSLFGCVVTDVGSDRLTIETRPSYRPNTKGYMYIYMQIRSRDADRTGRLQRKLGKKEGEEGLKCILDLETDISRLIKSQYFAVYLKEAGFLPSRFSK